MVSLVLKLPFEHTMLQINSWEVDYQNTADMKPDSGWGGGGGASTCWSVERNGGKEVCVGGGGVY